MPKKKSKKWSQQVSDNSDAMDLKEGVFKQRSAKKIADSLKQSAEQSSRRKASPFQSAMSMLNFYINRAGAQLSKAKRTRLEKAKAELRKDFGRNP
ncbi:hypothetical protein C7U61_12350 [Rhizobium sp. JAB6]|uniref:DUF3175 domain-containing protein n=1 Tax=Rhizobium sp. JAB6 TaxID=2127050 RepID=UPI000D122B41|nr:DUF3175 domain-containing protein [Rhizobium sp. JAB6]PST20056.1 hypothetical protein C7U61_12350 [Rhizobium sp. JAB6]